MSQKSCEKLAKVVDIILNLIGIFICLLFIAVCFGLSKLYDIAIIDLIILGAVLCLLLAVYLIILFIAIIKKIKAAKKSDH